MASVRASDHGAFQDTRDSKWIGREASSGFRARRFVCDDAGDLGGVPNSGAEIGVVNPVAETCSVFPRGHAGASVTIEAAALALEKFERGEECEG